MKVFCKMSPNCSFEIALPILQYHKPIERNEQLLDKLETKIEIL